MKPTRLALWLALPALVQAADALAWGLYTHVYFAQLLIWAVPLADPALRRAVRRFPARVMAGACLPDLAIVGRTSGTPAFSASHDWDTAHALLERARDDEARACAIGAISHLWVDIIAHNHFVPSHEHLWGHVPTLTHAACEWAMDHHIAHQLFHPPARLLAADDWLVAHVAEQFDCSPVHARRALKQLAGAEALLRGSRLPALLYAAARRADRHLGERFDYYLQETTRRLPQFNRVLAGEAPAWSADCPPLAVSRERMAAHERDTLKTRLPLPVDLFEPDLFEADRFVPEELLARAAA